MIAMLRLQQRATAEHCAKLVLSGKLKEYCNCNSKVDDWMLSPPEYDHDDLLAYINFPNKANFEDEFCDKCDTYKYFLSPNQEPLEDFYKVLKEMNE